MSRHTTDDGFDLFFNRDELRTRPTARPPAIHTREAVRFAAPTDSEGGGSWIAVNEFGLAACLLNGFSTGGLSEPRPSAITRGTLPLTMMPCRTTTEARGRLDALALERYRPFVLVVMGPRAAGWCARWNGHQIAIGEHVESPLISSSFFTEEVRGSRESVFEALRSEIPHEAIDRHLSFHRSHRPRRGAHSPCMHREDAHTVSMTRVTVNADTCRLSYWGDAPCRAVGEGQTLELERRMKATATDDVQ